MKQKLNVVSAFEVMWENYYRHAVEKVPGTRDPFSERHAFYVLIESEGNDAAADEERFQAALYRELEAGRLEDAVVARSLQDRHDFWAIRDAVGDILRSVTEVANFDIGIPLNETESCMREIETRLKAGFGDLLLLIFGHVGDGNLHLIASTGEPGDKNRIYDLVYRITGEHHGGIAAEHGIGVLKKPWLHLSRSEEEIRLMKTLKTALDPNNILNPGRVI